MKQEEVFGKALWISLDSAVEKRIVVKSSFSVSKPKNVKIRLLGLGIFHAYINGVRISDDLFLPLATDYEEKKDLPVGESLAHRIYVPEYDVTDMLREGENELIIHCGGGWYTYDLKVELPFVHDTKYGDAKAIFRIFGEDSGENFEHLSSENDFVSESFVTDYFWCNCKIVETQDFTHEESFVKAVAVKPLDTDYLFTTCPTDRIVRYVTPKKLVQKENYTLFDIGENLTFLPEVRVFGKKGKCVKLRFYEEIGEDMTPLEKHSYGQVFTLICDGTERVSLPLFNWYSARYITLEGDAELVRVGVVHSAVSVISEFDSDSEILNWLNRAYINTQLGNMHSGIPSDCPHIERRGYTGDGQLTCHAAMTILDAREFYRKWICDIADCQDRRSGHIQYTAPYFYSGGGPGGWGCAIVEVPYVFWKHYGDTTPLCENYDGMLRYFDYLEAHSENGLVVSDEEGKWCLGDWCTSESVVLPAPFVNNYFYVKSLDRVIEISRVIGREENIPLLEKRRKERADAMTRSYYNSWDGNFLGGVQGANAFAVDIGIGDERTYQNLVERYRKLGYFDTGIFGTDLVVRVMLEKGDAQAVFDLITSSSDTSFYGMMKRGATTIWEYFPNSLCDRSHNHPMFGAVAAYLYDYFLGIKQKNGTVGYKHLEISPVTVDGLNRVSGMAHGTKVSYVKEDSLVKFEIEIPDGISADFVFGDLRKTLSAGKNLIEIKA